MCEYKNILIENRKFPVFSPRSDWIIKSVHLKVSTGVTSLSRECTHCWMLGKKVFDNPSPATIVKILTTFRISLSKCKLVAGQRSYSHAPGNKHRISKSKRPNSLQITNLSLSSCVNAFFSVSPCKVHFFTIRFFFVCVEMFIKVFVFWSSVLLTSKRNEKILSYVNSVACGYRKLIGKQHSSRMKLNNLLFGN